MGERSGLTASFERCSADRETAKTLLVYVPELDGKVWIPKSVIHDDSEVYGMADEGELVVHEWFAVKQGWV